MSRLSVSLTAFGRAARPASQQAVDMESAHVGPERLAAYLDHQLTPAVREEVIAHYAECASCRREMTAMRVLLQARAKRRQWYIATPLLAAIAAVIVVVAVPSIRRVNTEPTSAIRSAPGITPTDQPQTISTISPADDAVLAERGAAFVWRSAGVGATYRLTLQDSTGTTVWASSMEDTSAVVPDSLRLSPGAYYWSVAARLPNAASAKTGVRRFLAR
jgi:hypothetical protein